MHCYLSHNYRDFAHAGTKSKNYIEHVLADMGFKNISIHQTHFHNKVLGFFATLTGVAIAPFRLHKGDILVLQYPIKKYYEFICRCAHLRGAKVITLVHDLGSFRRKKLTPEKEMQRLGLSDYIIIHNENMKRWINEHGRTEGVGIHWMFDYLEDAQAPVRKAPEGRISVLYAGSLPRKKNMFLYTLAEGDLDFELELCGRGLDTSKEMSSNVHYHGFVSDRTLIGSDKFNFGLVWDGHSLDACEGPYGGYLRYNNPLKASMYVRCHLPLIVWEHAAIAPMVKKKGIGICVSTLRNLGETLSKITPEQYNELEKNVIAWSKELKNGSCTRAAIQEGVDWLEQKQ